MPTPVTYESVLLGLGFCPDGLPHYRDAMGYVVPDGDFGFSIASEVREPKVQTVTAFLCLPGRPIIDCNPKWDVEPEDLERLIPDLYQWALETRRQFSRPPGAKNEENT